MKKTSWMQVSRQWVEVPEWAKWLAQDRSGHWYWYEKRPAVDTAALGGDGRRSSGRWLVTEGKSPLVWPGKAQPNWQRYLWRVYR